jgi:hypothetical protein
MAKKTPWRKTPQSKFRKAAPEFNENALFIDGFKDDPYLYDSAIIGITTGQGVCRIVYDAGKVVDALARYMVGHRECKRFEAYTHAQEWHDFNTFCAWHGENTPVFITTDV